MGKFNAIQEKKVTDKSTVREISDRIKQLVVKKRIRKYAYMGEL